MRARIRDLATASLWALGIACLAPAPADAQSAGDSLGGFGAPPGIAGMGTGGGAMVIPYGGMTEGFMPGRMGGGSSLSFRARTGAGARPSRAPMGLPPLSSASGGMGRGIGPRSSMSSPTGLRGMGPGGNPPRFGSGGAGMGVMPPRIGYPFRQPPSLLGPSSGLPGMSM